LLACIRSLKYRPWFDATVFKTNGNDVSILMSEANAVILLLFAFPAEMEPMRRRLSVATPLQPGLSGVKGRLGEIELAMLTTGIGIRRARAAAEFAFTHLPKIDLAIATGVAGALSNELKVGDIVVANDLLTRARDGDAAQHVHQVPSSSVAAIEKALTSAGIPCSIGGILTVSRALSKRADKVAAGNGSGAIAVDMESAAIASEARQRGIRFACARAILDTVEHELAGAELADEEGRIRAGAAAVALLRNPRIAISGIRLMRNLRYSTAVLARALEVLACAQV
jgi:adenosylhomocysteine nucleosidase